MAFIFEQIQTGGDRNFGYLIGDRNAKSALLVDPSYQPELLVERARAQGLNITHVCNTHGHGDHTNGNNTVCEMTDAKIAVFRESSVPHEIDLDDGSELMVGQYSVRILHLPGHAPDHIVLYLPDFQIALTGDHLFVGKIGGTSNDRDAKQQFESLMRLGRELPPETTIWPGHNVGCRPSSTLKLEFATNPFLIEKELAAFLKMKENWSRYKSEMGLL